MNMTIDVTQVALAAITVLLAVITGYAVPYLKEKLDEEKFNKLYKWTVIAVKAADQLAKSGLIDLEKRKEEVVKFLKNKGFTINMEEIEMLIESIVMELPHIFNGDEDDPEVTDAMKEMSHQ